MLSSRDKATSEPSHTSRSHAVELGNEKTRPESGKADTKAAGDVQAARERSYNEKEHAKARRRTSEAGLDKGTAPQLVP